MSPTSRFLTAACLPGLIVAALFAQTERPRRAAAAPAAVPPHSLAAYRPITDLNIFDSLRIDRSRLGSASGPSAPPVQVITLVGTMSYPKGLFAFFESTDASLRKVVPVGSELGPFRVTKVEPDSVELTHDGAALRLQVTQQLRRSDGADWTVAEAPVATVAPTREVEAPTATVPANASEALLRLMEKRKQQLQKP